MKMLSSCKPDSGTSIILTTHDNVLIMSSRISELMIMIGKKSDELRVLQKSMQKMLRRAAAVMSKLNEG
jgi:hypothetical protein